MATHDYVIDNSTGANVRADINTVLQAILTNNSSSSAPSTTAAYMWWADTTNGVLKIRNSADNAWIELLQLDGTITLENGTVSAPSLSAKNDLNTGVFFSAADKFNVAAGGVERMELGTTTIFNDDGNDVDFRIEGNSQTHLFFLDAGNHKIGINESSPDRQLHITDSSFPAVRLENSTTAISNGTLIGGFEFAHLDSSSSGVGAGILAAMANTSTGALDLIFKTGTGTSTYAETMRLTKDGHLLVGANANIHTGEGAEIQSVSTVGAGITLARNDTTVSNGSNIGVITAYGNDADGTFQECGKIEFQADLNHGTGDKPTAIVFSTTKDGQSSATEKFRVKSGGDCEIADGNLLFASGHGINFNATADGSGTGITAGSELFEDYEEGTWTPTISNSNNTGTTTGRVCVYRKIGKMVFFTFDFFQNSDNMSININGNSVIGGLPFTTPSSFNSTMNIGIYKGNAAGQQITNYIDTTPQIVLHGNGELFSLRHIWGHGCYPTT